MANGSGEPSATALVGMDGFVVVAQTVADGEHWLLIETAATRSWCPDCGVAGVGNGHRRVKVRDLPFAGILTVLVWSKRTFRCPEALCGRGSWSETSPLIAARASRRRVQQNTLGHRGHKHDPLYGIRRLLLRTWDHLSEHGWERLRTGLAAGDPDGGVALVWLARELLVEVYAAEDLAHAKRRLVVFFQHAADAEIPELTRLARTIDAWRDEILAFHTIGGASDGPTEAINLIIEKIRRIGHGYRNFNNYRRRLLLGCGITWTTVPARRIRGRQPRSVA